MCRMSLGLLIFVDPCWIVIVYTAGVLGLQLKEIDAAALLL
jgi:hypothetical protein